MTKRDAKATHFPPSFVSLCSIGGEDLCNGFADSVYEAEVFALTVLQNIDI